MKTKSIAKKLFILGLIAVGAFGVFSTPSKAVFRPCICPDVYAPVLCPNGLIYSNSCRASCAGQHGCVPANTI